MNTNSLKRFATVARNLLMQGVRNRLKAVGFNDDGSVRVEPVATGNSAIFDGQVINDTRFVARWNALRDRIASHGVKEVVEEAAYTWFNRLMAIRILEYNSLAPALLDYENPEIRIPRIVTDARAGKTPVLSDEDRASLEAVIGDGRLSFEQFSLLIRAYCENNPIIRKCFGGITDYTALLLPADILAEDGFIDLLNKAGEFIKPDDYRKPELIGWLYQFYIAEKKDEVFAKKGGYDSDEIPAATQIFTPNWIVKYMVENTLGRIYLDNNPDSTISENWKYLVEPAEPTPDDAILRYDSLEDLKCGDLSCGSGHILNEMFDLLYALYAEDFYSPREAIEAIHTKNMVGLDLDDRARQLAQFALLLKACQTDTAFADGHCMPRIYSMPEVNRYTWRDLGGHFNCAYDLSGPGEVAAKEIEDAFIIMENANVLGSIMKFEIGDEARKYMLKAISEFETNPKHEENFTSLINGFRVILALTDKYAALCMNPPYLVPSKNPILGKYAKENYPDSWNDLATVFIDVMSRLTLANGQFSYIIPPSWMFLSGFEKLRRKIIDNLSIQSLLHLSRGVFGADFGASSAVIKNCINGDFKGTYFRLIERTFQEFDQKHLQKLFEKVLVNHEFKFLFKEYSKDINSIEHSEQGNRIYYTGIRQNQFKQIPGAPFAYWLDSNWLNIFKYTNIRSISISDGQTKTGDNNKYLREVWEVSANAVGKNKKWLFYAKGGSFRRWYGNLSNVINWSIEARTFYRKDKIARILPEYLWYEKGITWNYICSGDPGFRLLPSDAVFDVGGSSLFFKDDVNLLPALALTNTKISKFLLKIFNPTINVQVSDIQSLPLNTTILDNDEIRNLTSGCVAISKEDWDSHETSWDFETSPLLAVDSQTYCDNIDWMIECHRRKTGEQICIDPAAPELGSLQWRYDQYCQKWEYLFDRLHHNEEELNRKFIDIYGLQDELTPDVALEDVTILQHGEIKIVDEAALELETGGVLTTESGETLTVGIAPQIEWQKDVVIKQFISYAVGCMMGRYRLDRPGLAIAHPNPSADEYAPYVVPRTGEQWWIDDDGIVPMMGEDSPFHDNAANRFTEFVRVALGNEYLTENMNFVRDALGKDVVDYFRSDFYNDHKKMYQNRPIYWMFSSNQKGKRAAFQCLVYMHRMNRFTPEHIRTNYLLPYIDHLAAREAELSARSSLSAKENKLLKQLRSDLEECRDYQLRLHEFADRQIEIDLDDGVVKNYATFAPVLAKLK